MYTDFEYLAEIASLPHAPTDGPSEFDEGSVPAYLWNVVDQVTTETGGLASADDPAALRADIAAAWLGRRPELEWPARWHSLFLRTPLRRRARFSVSTTSRLENCTPPGERIGHQGCWVGELLGARLRPWTECGAVRLGLHSVWDQLIGRIRGRIRPIADAHSGRGRRSVVRDGSLLHAFGVPAPAAATAVAHAQGGRAPHH